MASHPPFTLGMIFSFTVLSAALIDKQVVVYSAHRPVCFSCAGYGLIKCQLNCTYSFPLF